VSYIAQIFFTVVFHFLHGYHSSIRLFPHSGNFLSELGKGGRIFFLIGGFSTAGKGTSDIYLSIDKGVSWALADSMVMLPAVYTGRGDASVVVEKSKFMLIFGGKSTTGGSELNETWRGRINRLGFKE
jgi:hypothetical protein